MAHRTLNTDRMNHRRQIWYLNRGIVMIPTLKREMELRKLVRKIKSAADNVDMDTLMPAT